MKNSKITLLGLLMAVTLPVMAMSLQQAMDALDGAKAKGFVGEKPDGYLGVVSNADNSADIVKLINEARRAQYQKVAKDNNISLPDVEAVAGKKAIEKTQQNYYIQVNGQWLKKP